MATSESGPPLGGPHDFSEDQHPREDVATRLELRDIAAIGEDLARSIDDVDDTEEVCL